MLVDGFDGLKEFGFVKRPFHLIRDGMGELDIIDALRTALGDWMNVVKRCVRSESKRPIGVSASAAIGVENGF